MKTYKIIVKIDGCVYEEKIMYFSSYEEVQLYLQEYLKNMGYEINRIENEIIIGEMYDDTKNAIIELTIDFFEIY